MTSNSTAKPACISGAVAVKSIVLCEHCTFLKRCRAVCRCDHPYGLKQPKPEAGTFCSFGVDEETAKQADQQE